MDTKQSPYRILYRRVSGTSFLQVAAAETEKKAEVAWSWIEGLSSLHIKLKGGGDPFNPTFFKII